MSYPMHGYLYNLNGTHGPPFTLATQEELDLFLHLYGPVALQSHRELLIVSGDDEDCFLHIQDGHVLHAGGGDLASMEGALRRGLSSEPAP